MEELGWAYEFCQDSDARITELICIPDISKKFLECFPEVLTIDRTHKTNRYKLLLFDIIGQTNTNLTFYAGFGLLAAEDEVRYSWAIRSMRTLLGEKLAEQIKVVAASVQLLKECMATKALQTVTQEMAKQLLFSTPSICPAEANRTLSSLPLRSEEHTSELQSPA